MTKVIIAEEIAERIRRSEGPIELVDSHGQTIGVVRRPPSEAEIDEQPLRAFFLIDVQAMVVEVTDFRIL